MENPQRRYWAVRTDKNNQGLLYNEVRSGRLRQGWGYDSSQDLRVVRAEMTKGEGWWDRLSEAQRAALPNMRMLSSTENSIQVGDWLLLPNLPEYGLVMVAEVTGEYCYDPVKLSEEQDVNELGMDYGHVLPIRLLTEQGVNKYAEGVHADIRRTLRAQSRMWNVDKHAKAIEQLVKACKTGCDVSMAQAGEARLDTAWEMALRHAGKELRKQLESELDTRFRAAEWEEPICIVLRSLYASADVQWTGGPQENGADVVVRIPNHFGALPWLILVQVKDYVQEIGAGVLTQLRVAYERYSKDGRVLALVVMTTAERTSADFAEAAEMVSKELGVPVEAVTRKKMMDVLSEGLLTRMKADHPQLDES